MKPRYLLILMTLSTVSSILAEWGGLEGNDGVKFVSEVQTAAGVNLPPNSFSAATFSVWCYSSGRGAVGNQEGVIDVAMLLRNKPFGEWVTVYYDPAKVTEEILLDLLRKKRCPKAAVVREEGKRATVMNPFIAPGDTVQVRVDPTLRTHLLGMTLPKGWKILGKKESGPADGDLLIQSPEDAPQGKMKLELQFSEQSVTLNVNLVRRM